MAQGYKDFTAGAVLTAADLEDYNQNQSVMRFANAAARDAALTVVKTEGMLAYLIDVNTMTVYNGSVWSTIGPIHGLWTSYIPTWSGTTGNGTITGAYQRLGRTINWWAKVAWGSTTSHAAALQSLTLPVAPEGAYPANSWVGGASSIQVGVDAWQGACYWTSSGTTINIIGGTSQASGTAARITNLVPFTWGNGHALWCTGMYQAGADA